MAWYPIYRIPIGELRASFLTFHLFSHLVIKNCMSSSEIIGNCVVSPVVGFQSYHAKVVLNSININVLHFEL